MSSTLGTTERSNKFGGFVKIAGLALLGAGLVLGGCNNKLKEENEALAKESAELRQSQTKSEMERQALEQRVQSLSSENQNLNQQLVATKGQPQSWGPGGGNDTEYPGKGQKQRTGKGQANSGNEHRIVISGDNLFAAGSASLKPEAKRELDRVVSELRSAHSITIEGYTDSDPIRKANAKYKTNEALSKARANAVRDYLANKGVNKNKMATIGKGAAEPLETKAKSRRVEIVIAE